MGPGGWPGGGPGPNPLPGPVPLPGGGGSLPPNPSCAGQIQAISQQLQNANQQLQTTSSLLNTCSSELSAAKLEIDKLRKIETGVPKLTYEISAFDKFGCMGPQLNSGLIFINQARNQQERSAVFESCQKTSDTLSNKGSLVRSFRITTLEKEDGTHSSAPSIPLCIDIAPNLSTFSAACYAQSTVGSDGLAIKTLPKTIVAHRDVKCLKGELTTLITARFPEEVQEVCREAMSRHINNGAFSRVWSWSIDTDLNGESKKLCEENLSIASGSSASLGIASCTKFLQNLFLGNHHNK